MKNKKNTVLLDTSPLSDGNSLRGVGTYTRELLQSLQDNPDQHLEIVSRVQDGQNIDLLHIPYFELFFRSLPFIKTQPTIVTIHDVIPLKYPKHFPLGKRAKIILPIQKLLLKQIDHIITDSQASKNDISSYLQINTNKITSIPLAASPDFFPVSQKKIDQLQDKYSLPKEFILFVGSISYNKNLPLLIKAIRTYKTIPLVINTRTDIHSSETEKQTRMILDAVLSELQQTPNNLVKIITVDTKEELNCLYNAAKVYVHPSLDEGFGLPLLEAMQAGTPVISSNAGSLPEVGGSVAHYFESSNFDSLVKEIHTYSQMNQETYMKWSKVSIKHAKTFTWNKTAQQVIDVYKKVLNISA